MSMRRWSFGLPRAGQKRVSNPSWGTLRWLTQRPLPFWRTPSSPPLRTEPTC